MADAGEVKARVSIEYNGEGIKQAKEDLASLAEAAGSVGASAGNAGEGLTGLEEQMASSAERAHGFSSAIGELPKIMEGGTSTISEMTGMLSEHQSALEETGAAYESFSENMQKASTSLKDGVESANLQNANLNTVAQMWADPAPFEMLQQHLQTTGQSWADFSASVGEDRVAQIEALKSLSEGSYPLLDTMSSKVEATSTTFAKSAENMQVLNEVVSNSGESFNTITSSAHDADQAVSEFLGNRKGFSAFADVTTDANQAVAEFLGKTNSAINEFGGVGEKLYGPMPAMKSVGFGEAFGEAFSSVTGFLDQIAMPLMAVQMIGMAVQQVGQAMYDSAAIAEGPAAHSFGTFTGTVDALGQSLQRAGGQFSEGFGQALLPTLNALNSQIASGDLEGLGQFAGGIASTIANLTMITTGVNPWGGVQGLINQGAQLLGLPQPFQGPGPANQAQVTYEQSVALMPQTVSNLRYQTKTQADQLLQMASDPSYLQSQDEYQAAQTIYEREQQRYNGTHYVSPQQLLMQYQEQQYDAQQAQNYAYQQANPTYAPFDPLGFWGSVFNGSMPYDSAGSQALGTKLYQSGGSSYRAGSGPPSTPFDGLFGFFGGIGKSLSDIWNAPNGGADTLGMLFSPKAWGFGGDQSPQTFTGGCFVAGTPVLLADGRSKPIETLRVDDVVLAHNGKQQISATIIGCISFPAKQTYKLTFSDGKTLLTTDSHPIATTQGWKSISPESTAQENPGLPVTTLQIGDSIHTADGTLCRLLSIQKREITTVYNITVNPHHTYYAGGILVHNAKASSVGSMTNGGVGSEQVQLSHTFTANIQWEANNLTKQFTGAASWVGQNLANTFMGAASWVAQGLSNTFQGVANWVGQGLANTFQGVANWVGQGLENTFQGVANWVGQGLSNTFQGVANWVGQGLNNTFKGVASWVGSGLEHTFNAVANWTAWNLTPNFTVNPSFTMLAEGTSNWPGGPAIVGEGGAPEVVEHNGQYSLIDHATLLDLPSGANVYPMKNLQGGGIAQFADGTGNYMLPLTIGIPGGGTPQSINISVHLDSQTILSAIELPMAQNIRVGSGLRSY